MHISVLVTKMRQGTATELFGYVPTFISSIILTAFAANNFLVIVTFRTSWRKIGVSGGGQNRGGVVEW